jgi:2-haloacid dehalogenase
MEDQTGIRALAFDLYGTLLDVRSVEAACGEVVPDAAAFAALWRAKQLEYTYLRALMGRYVDFGQVTRDALAHTVDRFSALQGFRIRLDEAARAELLNAWLRLVPFPEVLAALETIGRRGLPLAVLSNGAPAMLEAALTHAGLRQRFAHVLSVDSVRTFKPAPAVYQLACDAFGLSAAEIGFVSSNGWDAAGGAAFGFQAYWINRTAQPPERLGAPLRLEVRGLDELADALDA